LKHNVPAILCTNTISFVQVNFSNTQLFASAVHLLTKQTSKQMDASLDARLRACTEALSKSFADLDSVLGDPCLDYSVLTNFYVNAVSKLLKAKLASAKLIVHEVCTEWTAP
jgi:hypothetical protein